MPEEIIQPVRLFFITIAFFLLKKYVFMEPDFESVKKQNIFYIITVFITFTAYAFFGLDFAVNVLSIIVAVNVFFARKKRRIVGALAAIIPIAGMSKEIFVPFLDVLSYVFYIFEGAGIIDNGVLPKGATLVYESVFCVAVFILLAVFLFKGKSWRIWFDENMQGRHPGNAEMMMLWTTGILLKVFDGVVTDILSSGLVDPNPLHHNYTDGEEMLNYISYIMVMILESSFGFTVIIIMLVVLVLQGQKRTLYHEKLANIQEGMITFMADVVENRDGNTGGHIKRTANYVEYIAKELKNRGAYKKILTDEYLKNLIVAAPLHDIGKIHISDVILNKPGRLTNEEFDIMKAHTTAGEDLLNHAKEELGEYSYLTMAIEMAAYHHEWWNGNGYPYGISGEEIPLCARIMAIADVFDALVSKRIYKDAMSLEKAYSIIREESGTHFDPEIVDAFFAVTYQFGLDAKPQEISTE